MTFPYQGYPVRGVGGITTLVYRPSIPIRFVGPASESVSMGLLDTGADDILLPDRLIAVLGVTIESGMQTFVRGIDGLPMTVQFGNVDLQLHEHRCSARVGFYAGIKVLLGHVGFLEHFNATFNGAARTVRLLPIGRKV